MNDTARDRLKSRITEIVIRDSQAWERLHARLQAAYTRAWTLGMTEATRTALEALRALEPGRFTAADGEKIIKQFAQSVGPEAMQRLLNGPVIHLSEAIWRVGQKEVGQAAGVDIRFGQRDRRALAILERGNLYWIGNSWNVFTQGMLDAALKDAFEQGLTRAQLAERMQSDFAGLEERGRHYWELLADHAATKTRELGRTSGYEAAGLQYVQVRAHLDSRTSAICRHMHGRILTVDRLAEQRDTYLAALARRDMEGAKAAWTMHSEAGAAGLARLPTARLPTGTGAPPYHFRCRTITVAWFGARGGQIDIPAGMPADDRAQIEARSPDEWRNVVADVRRMAQAGKLPYAPGDLADDVRKTAVVLAGSAEPDEAGSALRKHAEELGLQATAEALTAKANAIAWAAERVFARVYQGEVQLSFCSNEHQAYAVVDLGLQLRGAYGHANKEGGWEKCLKEYLTRCHAELK